MKICRSYMKKEKIEKTNDEVEIKNVRDQMLQN